MAKACSFRELVEHSLPLYSVDMGAEQGGRRPTGADFENMVTLSNKAYERMKYGIVKKNHVRTIYVRGSVIQTEKSTVDYDGFLNGIGFVAFDAKSTEDEIWRPDRKKIHQFLFLLNGQRWMTRDRARFFYLVRMRRCEDWTGSLRRVERIYLVENLEAVADAGRYEPNECDEVKSTPGVLVDYRRKLLETP